jgi:peptidoglycan hydrolase CwlO-like protein
VPPLVIRKSLTIDTDLKVIGFQQLNMSTVSIETESALRTPHKTSQSAEVLKEANKKLKSKIDDLVNRLQGQQSKYSELEYVNGNLKAMLEAGGKKVNVNRKKVVNPNAKRNATIRKLTARLEGLAPQAMNVFKEF